MTEYTVDIDAILKMADNSYAVANNYAEVIRKISAVDAAVGHLTDKDGVATAADTDVIALIDEFVKYLKTTSSRYHIAADQLVASADAYTATEDAQRAVFERYLNDMADNAEDVANRDYSNADWNPDEEADQTDLGLHRLGQHPLRPFTHQLIDQRHRTRRTRTVITRHQVGHYAEHRAVPSQPTRQRRPA